MSDLMRRYERQALRDDRSRSALVPDDGLLMRYERMAGEQGDTFSSLGDGARFSVLRTADNFVGDGSLVQFEYACQMLPEGMRDEARKQYERGLTKCESAIEKRLLPWLLCQPYSCFMPQRPRVLFSGEADQLEPYSVAIVPQLPIGRYRTDFALAARRAGPIRFVIVECDGAEFHKDVHRDVARDAALLRSNRVLDVQFFSGSEIRKHPKLTAAKASRALTDAWAKNNLATQRKFEAGA